MAKVKKQTNQDKEKVIPRGMPKSGRPWKNVKQKYSTMKADKPLKTSWTQKMKNKLENKAVKKFEKGLKDAKAQAKEDKKKRREENLKRREENAKKAEVVQVIKNPQKLKRMTKKQLRNSKIIKR